MDNMEKAKRMREREKSFDECKRERMPMPEQKRKDDEQLPLLFPSDVLPQDLRARYKKDREKRKRQSETRNWITFVQKMLAGLRRLRNTGH